MGSRIAAHLANAGVATVLLDIVAPNSAPDLKPGASSQIAAAGSMVRANLSPLLSLKPRWRIS